MDANFPCRRCFIVQYRGVKDKTSTLTFACIQEKSIVDRMMYPDDSNRKKRYRSSSSRRRTTSVRLSDFTCIQEPHPFGILPGGNRFFGSSSESTSLAAYGSQNEGGDVFDDKIWQHILGFCEGCSLGRVVQASRKLYVLGHQSELWRDLVLRKCHSENTTISKTGRSWKDTFVLLFHGEKHFVGLLPMRMPGIYSDSIYQSHLCRSFAIPSAWLEHSDGNEGRWQGESGTVPSIRVESLTPEEFFSGYEEPNQPVVVEGAAAGKAVDSWRNWGYLHKHNSKSKVFRTIRSTSVILNTPISYC